MAAEQKPRKLDALDELIRSDPNANPVEGSHQVWLLTGDQVKVAREALTTDDESAPVE
jgi:hypothetical protein